MARINYMNLVVGVGVGAVDEVLERKDKTDKKTGPFKGWRDYGRLGLTVAGLAGQMFDFFPSIAEPLAQSEITRLTKSLAQQLMPQKITMREISGDRLSRISGGDGRIGRTHEEEFANVLAI